MKLVIEQIREEYNKLKIIIVYSREILVEQKI